MSSMCSKVDDRNATYLEANARNEVGVLADSGNKYACKGAPARRGAAGASSTMTWAFVPPNPKELTPARRGFGPDGQGSRVRGTRSGTTVQSICGVSVSQCICGGIAS